MSKENGFDKLLDQTPDDWVLRSVYADWLSDQGREAEEAAQRWMIKFKKYPQKWGVNSKEYTYDWNYFHGEYNPSCHRIGSQLFNLVARYASFVTKECFCEFKSRKDAELELALGLINLHQERVALTSQTQARAATSPPL